MPLEIRFLTFGSTTSAPPSTTLNVFSKIYFGRTGILVVSGGVVCPILIDSTVARNSWPIDQRHRHNFANLRADKSNHYLYDATRHDRSIVTL